MDEMTQRNASLVEEAAASSRSLEEQAQLVLEQLNFFQTQLPADNAFLNVKQTPDRAADLKQPPLRSPKVDSSQPIVNSDDEWEEF
jgi:methyl-accepting chemotaxis protein